jgi:hypothetical protein
MMCFTRQPNGRRFGGTHSVMPAPGSSARGQAKPALGEGRGADIHDLPLLQQRKSWMPAFAGMTAVQRQCVNPFDARHDTAR